MPNLISGLNKSAASHIQNGISTDINRVQFPLTVGVPMPSLVVVNYIPAPTNNLSVAPTQTVVVGVPMTLINTTVTSSGRIQTIPVSSKTYSSTASTISYGNPIFPSPADPSFFIVEQGLGIHPSSGTFINNFNILIQGYDNRGVAVSETLIVSATSPGANSNKTYAVINSLTCLGDPGGQINCGWSAILGLPYALLNINHVVYAAWNNTFFPQGNITSLIGPALTWRQTLPNNTPRASSSYPLLYSTRGVFVPPTGSTGAEMATIMYYAYGADSFLNAQLQNYDQGALTMIQAKYNTAGLPLLPALVPQDLTGVQYPGDMDFINSYTALLAS